jgi:hypothetical protein
MKTFIQIMVLLLISCNTQKHNKSPQDPGIRLGLGSKCDTSYFYPPRMQHMYIDTGAEINEYYYRVDSDGTLTPMPMDSLYNDLDTIFGPLEDSSYYMDTTNFKII